MRAPADEAFAEYGSIYSPHIILIRCNSYKSNMQRLSKGAPSAFPLDENAQTLLRLKYLTLDLHGLPMETPEGLFSRVCKHVAKAESPSDRPSAFTEFNSLLSERVFLPSTPVLVGSGLEDAQLFTSLALPFRPFNHTKRLLIAAQRGGSGTSYRIPVAPGEGWNSTLARMVELDVATRSVRQNGRRQGCSLALMDASDDRAGHFVKAKTNRSLMPNTGTSIAASDGFLSERAEDGNEYLFGSLVRAIYEAGEPGVIFSDRIKGTHSTQEEAGTSACAEVPLASYEACNLGAIDVSKLVDEGVFDFDYLMEATKLAVRFLDDVYDVTSFPSPEIRRATLRSRKLGIGVMGLADLFALMEMEYGDDSSISLASQIASAMRETAVAESVALADERGRCVAIEGEGLYRRNAGLLAIPPSGSISVIAGCSTGIEPFFSFPAVRHTMDGIQLLEASRVLLSRLRDRNVQVTSRELIEPGLPSDIATVLSKEGGLFKPATEVTTRQHLAIAKAFQDHFDNSISKTVTLPGSTTLDDIEVVILEAWRLGLKGISVFRPACSEKLIFG
jgi:ribonucleoside-diphosphate reductase alpha chain